MMANHGAFPSVYKGSLLLPRPSNSAPLFLGHGRSSSSSVMGKSAALKIHSQTEKRRRERINAHLSTLRRMVPDASKMDKASLLGRVIDHMKDLKRKAIDIGKGFAIPTEANDVTVDCEEGDHEHTTTEEDKSFYIKASICCDDRPDLFVNLVQAFHSLTLRTIRADITCLGGRVQIVFILCGKDGNGSVCLSSLKESIKEALGRIASFDMGSMDASSSKRQRLLQSHYTIVSLQ